MKGGARLGVVAIKHGYARPTRALPARFVNRLVKSKARNGVPVGAAVFGRVRAKAGGASGSGGASTDQIDGGAGIDTAVNGETVTNVP